MTGLTARGVGLYLDIRVDQLNYMLNKGVLLDMGAWIQTSASIHLLPYTLQTFPLVVAALEPDQWLLQAGSAALNASTTDCSRSWVPSG